MPGALLCYLLVDPTGRYLRAPSGWLPLTDPLPPLAGATYPTREAARQAAEDLYTTAGIVAVPVPLRAAR